MLLALFAFAVFQAGAPAAAESAAAPAPMGMTPSWVRKPSGREVERFYPRKALREGISADTILSCRVNVSGQLEQCTAEATPAGIGFEAATLKMASHFRMKPHTPDGAPVAGGTVRIPLRWRPPQ